MAENKCCIKKKRRNLKKKEEEFILWNKLTVLFPVAASELRLIQLQTFWQWLFITWKKASNKSLLQIANGAKGLFKAEKRAVRSDTGGVCGHCRHYLKYSIVIILQTVISQLFVSTFLIGARATFQVNVPPGLLRLDKCRDYHERLCFGLVPFCCTVIGKTILILFIFREWKDLC